MATKNSKDGLSQGEKIGIGIGLSAATLAAVGGYFLYGSKDAKKNRKTVKGWMLKAKGEVLEGIEKAKELTEADYAKLVDNAVKGYKAARSASATEIAEFTGEMKKYWKDIQKAHGAKNPVSRGGKKSSHTASKKK